MSVGDFGFEVLCTVKIYSFSDTVCKCWTMDIDQSFMSYDKVYSLYYHLMSNLLTNNK